MTPWTRLGAELDSMSLKELKKGSHPSGSARGSGGGSNDHSARAAGGNVEGGAGITWCLLVWIARTALGQRSKQ